MLGRTTRKDVVRVRVPWGMELSVRSHDTIGNSLRIYNVYELAVSEVLWRLTDSGEWCLDIGANIGYMTGLLSVKVGVKGRVFGFEPHPLVFARLQGNVGGGSDNLCKFNSAQVTLMQNAAGSADTEMDLLEPEGFKENEGTASLSNVAQPSSHGIRHRVQVRRLDSIFNNSERFGVMKIDVEGAELAVLQGAGKLLSEKRIRDIVFEDFHPFPSECVSLLQRHGYKVFRINKAVLGPAIWDPSCLKAGKSYLPWEPTNYLATVDPTRAETRLRSRGWQCLRGK